MYSPQQHYTIQDESVEPMSHPHKQCIDKKGYYLHSTGIDEHVHQLERVQFYPAATRKNNIYSSYWMLYLYDLPAGRLKVQHGKKIINIIGPTAVYIPPLTPVIHHFAPGIHRWKAYYVNQQREAGLPTTPIAFRWNTADPLTTYGQIIDCIKKGALESPCNIEIGHSYVSGKVQTFLNNYYAEPVDLMNMAKDLKLPYSTILYSFQQIYGFSPIVYRNTLRVFEALKLIGQGWSMTDACFVSGFSDYSTFYRNFTAVLDNKPSEFLISLPANASDPEEIYLAKGYS